MPLLIAIDWDVREARIAAGTLRGKRMRIEHLFTVAWPGTTTFDVQATSERAAALQEAFRLRNIGRGEAIVAIGRTAVELKQLALPPAPDDELPEMVRFLAQREFHALAADGALDYVPTAAIAGEARSVLAATVDGSAMSHIAQVCEQAGLRLKRLLLRPAATASLALRRLPHDDVARLLVEPAADEAEVTALVGPNIVLLRSARMPGDTAAPEYARALSSELRRTLAAVHHQWPERRVERIELCGAADDWAATATKLASELVVAVDLVDPWKPLPEPLEYAATDEAAHGRFAAVLGMAADEAEGVRPRFDFVNPRRAAPPPNRRKQVLIGAFCATLLFAGIWLFAKSRLNGLDEEIVALKRTSSALEAPVKTAAEIERKATEIERWLKSDVVWLAELERLSRLAPSAEQLQLTQLRFTAHPQGGELQMSGLVSDADVVDELERRLRDAQHSIEGKGRQHDPQTSRYPWRFKSNLTVKTDAQAAKPVQANAPPIVKGGANGS
ncbi:MAG: hypothetical protein K8U03_13855 [Planctomycetia bacterium]|nr:hypothetical protein [Planctomycetia bacterium]